MQHGCHETVEQAGRASPYSRVQQLGDCHATIGNYAQAKRHYERAATLAPDEPHPYVGLGVVALLNHHNEDAELAFSVARRLDPACSKAYAGLALVEQERGHYKTAFDLYLQSLELGTDNLTALLGLFQTSCQIGSFCEVTHYLQAYLTSHPTDGSVLFCLATLHMRDGRLDQARRILADLVALEPGNHDAANLLEEIDHTLVRRDRGQPDASAIVADLPRGSVKPKTV